MALAPVSPPKQRENKVGALGNASAVFDILGSLGNLYGQFKPAKIAPPTAAGVAESATKTSAQGGDFLRTMAENRLTGKGPTVWSPNRYSLSKVSGK